MCVILIVATFNVSSLLQVAIITNMRFSQVLVEMKDTLQNFRFIENMTDDKIMILAKTGIFCHCAINVYEWAMVDEIMLAFHFFIYFLTDFHWQPSILDQGTMGHVLWRT